MKRLGYGVVALTVAGLIAINAMRLVGGLSKPPDRAILNLGACSLPCWHGIRPSATTLTQAETIIRADQTFHINTYTVDTLCWQIQSDTFVQGCAYTFKNVGADNNLVEIINLVPRKNAFHLGDAVSIFGLPVAAQPSCVRTNGNVYFPGNVIAVTPAGFASFGPETSIVYLSFVTNTQTPYWRGFNIYRSSRRFC